MIEIAQTRRQKEMPVSLLTARQDEAFGTALRTRVMDAEGGFSKRYLREFVSEIRFDGAGTCASNAQENARALTTACIPP